MTSIDTSLYLSNKATERKVGDALGKDDFLKLFITQLQNQDPSSPMDNSEFIAQMATFTTMEQIMNIGTKLDSLISIESQNSVLNYSTFVGKEVTWHTIDESADPPVIEEGTGVVQSIQFKNNEVTFILEDGKKLEPGNISKINNKSISNSLVAGSELIGKLVTWKVDDTEHSAIVTSVLMNNGKLQYQVDDEEGTKLTADQIIKIATP